jgi:hypothetical protein
MGPGVKPLVGAVMLTRPATSRPRPRPDEARPKTKAIDININEAFNAKVK